MSKVARRKELLETPAISLTAIADDPSRSAFSPPSPPLCAPDGRAVRVVHIVAELAPFARSGGLGEAVNSLARFQAASGIPTSIVMPLYDAVKANAPAIEPVGPAFRVQVGPRSEEVRLWRLVASARIIRWRRRASTSSRARSTSRGRTSTVRRGRTISTTGDATPASPRRRSRRLPAIAGSDPVLVHAHDWHTALAPVYLRTTLAGDERYPPGEGRAVGAQRGLPGPLSARGNGGPRSAGLAVQLAPARVVWPRELAQGRPRVRRRGHHGEPDSRARAPDRGRRIRTRRRVRVAARSVRRHRQRHRSADSGIRPPTRCCRATTPSIRWLERSSAANRCSAKWDCVPRTRCRSSR